MLTENVLTAIIWCGVGLIAGAALATLVFGALRGGAYEEGYRAAKGEAGLRELVDHANDS